MHKVIHMTICERSRRSTKDFHEKRWKTHVFILSGGVAALTGISFGVKQGEVFGVIGPNGAGKTTLFNLITGVFPVSSGEIVFDGMSVVGIKPHRTVEMGIARTFQNIRLFGNMTALETVLTGMHCRTGSGFVASFLRTKRQRIYGYLLHLLQLFAWRRNISRNMSLFVISRCPATLITSSVRPRIKW